MNNISLEELIMAVRRQSQVRRHLLFTNHSTGRLGLNATNLASGSFISHNQYIVIVAAELRMGPIA